MQRPSIVNAPTWSQRLARLRGSTVEYDLRPYRAPLKEIHPLGDELETLADRDLLSRSCRLVEEAHGEVPLDNLLPRAFALVREAARRTVGMRPYDVQVLAGVALHHGHVVEMQTGEGKTLAAVMPAYLNALTGEGVHVLTFNDYLARRDAEWMGPIYELLGLNVGWVGESLTQEERRAAYHADVTYVTAKQAGFDHLRDLLATRVEDLVHRRFHFALVDEADSLLIDEARIPLVLAGSVERETASALELPPLAPPEGTISLARLVRRLAPGRDFTIEEYSRNVELTEAGFDHVEAVLGCGNLLAEENYTLLGELNCALHAQFLLRRDADYIVRDGKIEIVDELTGRVAENRHWPDGLQAALEAKEGLERRSDGRILSSITLQHFAGGYERLCGMTGTAQAATREFRDFYGLSVVVVPTHRPMIREDRPDVVFTHREAKETALVDEVRAVQATGRPVLVGTLTVEESERLATRLRRSGVACDVLNARNDAMEAEIVARAGALGAVTISTNMAGRGTDIRLGGADEAEGDDVRRLGGLYVIGTNRHESRRIDLQLRGRAGRQGDPGQSRFFLSLEDDLMERYGIRRLIPPHLVPGRRDEPIPSPVVRREIARVQRIIEGQNFEIRKTLSRYGLAIENQRRALNDERRRLLMGAAPVLWRRREQRYRELVATAGEDAVRHAETAVTLYQVDRAWSEHLGLIASLREGIHLVGLGGEDPLTSFQVRTAKAFNQMRDEVDEAILASLDSVSCRPDGLDLDEIGLKGPSSTWTYLVNEDPFRQQLGRMLTGPGGATMAIGAAMFAAPFFMLWLLAERFLRKRFPSLAQAEAKAPSRNGEVTP